MVNNRLTIAIVGTAIVLTVLIAQPGVPVAALGASAQDNSYLLNKVEKAIESGDRTVAAAALREAQPYLMSSVNKGLVHRNTAARRLSRLSHRIKAMPA